MQRKLYLSLLLSTMLSLPAALVAQYPVIPEEVQQKGDAFMQEVAQQKKEAWAKALPKVQEEAEKGRPYIPWAGTPKALNQAAIPAFPGAEGGGMFTPGGRD